MALVHFRVLFEILWSHCVATFFGNGTNFIKPCFVIVSLIVSRKVIFQDSNGFIGRNLFKHWVFLGKPCIKEILGELYNLFCIHKILAWFFTVTTNCKKFHEVITLWCKYLIDVLMILLCPCNHEICNFSFTDTYEGFFADIFKFNHVEECTAGSHFIQMHREIFEWQFRICQAPFFVVGVQECHNIFSNSLWKIPFFFIEGKCHFWVFTLR